MQHAINNELENSKQLAMWQLSIKQANDISYISFVYGLFAFQFGSVFRAVRKYAQQYLQSITKPTVVYVIFIRPSECLIMNELNDSSLHGWYKLTFW